MAHAVLVAITGSLHMLHGSQPAVWAISMAFMKMLLAVQLT